MRSFVSLRQLIPRAHDRVIVFWERLVQWARQKDIVSVGPDARVSETIYGTTVTYEPRFPWDHPFRVSVSGRTATIRPGFLGDDMPTIGEIALDGIDPEGNQRSEPVYQIATDAEPAPDGRSFLCLIMVWDVERRAPLTETTDWLTVGHVSDLDFVRAEAGGYIAYEPLAVLYWRGNKIDRVRQIVHHNLVHSFLPGEGARPGKHFFSAV